MNFLFSILEFIQNQILGMKWLNLLVGNILEKLGLHRTSNLFSGVQFFFYDTIKITILLCTLIFFISYIQSYFPPEKSKKILGKFHGINANIIGALLGTVTPFCSCSSIPLFIGFTSAGLPLGVTFSFLISSPMSDWAVFATNRNIWKRSGSFICYTRINNSCDWWNCNRKIKFRK